MGKSLKHKTAIGVVWSAIERFASQGIQFLIGLVMARLLMPSDYGTIALLNVFLAICQTFIDSGFGLALMRKKDCSEKDFCTIFIFNFAAACTCLGALWFASPWIASFYNIPSLIIITRVVALNIIINALTNVPNAILSIALDFKKKAITTLATVVISGSIGLWMAYNNFGLWALVYQTLIASCVRAILIFVFAKWIPKLHFSKESFADLFSFGSKMLISGIIGNIYNNLTSILIGKFYSPTMLGLYGKASTLASYPSIQMTSVILNVAYPTLAKIQDDEQRLIEAYRRMLKMATFIIFPLMVGLAVVAKPFILFVLGDKWADMIPFLQILCFTMMWDPINGMNMNLLQVKGYSGTYLRVDAYKKIIGLVFLGCTLPFGIKAICYGLFVVALFNIPINTYYSYQLYKYGFIRQMKDILPIFMAALIMGLIVWLVMRPIETLLLKLVIGICSGVFSYLIINHLFNSEELKVLINIMKQFRPSYRANS